MRQHEQAPGLGAAVADRDRRKPQPQATVRDRHFRLPCLRGLAIFCGLREGPCGGSAARPAKQVQAGLRVHNAGILHPTPQAIRLVLGAESSGWFIAMNCGNYSYPVFVFFGLRLITMF